MEKTLKQKLAEAIKTIADRDILVEEYRQKRCAADQRYLDAEKRVDSLQFRVSELERSVAHWEGQVQRAEGHINGMRETLIGLDIIKEPKPVVHYDPQPSRSPEMFFPRRVR